MQNSETLITLAEAVADGRLPDWDEAESRASDTVERESIRELRAVFAIGKIRATLYTASLLAEELEPSVVLYRGATWGTLRIAETVGRGHFGTVYRAWDPALDREVALKLLRRRVGRTDGDDSHVIQEGRLMARIRHPNVATIYGAQTIDGQTGLWMEFVQGRTLEAELRDGGLLDAAELTRIGVDLAHALQAVHDAGLVHRDVKAQNVLREATGRVVLGDFGTGRELEDGEAAGELAGTPAYVAPEIFRKQTATPQSDIYSLGVLLFHLATGTYPVRGSSVRAIREGHAAGQRTRLRAARSDLPEALTTAIDRALAAEPAARFATASAFAQALQGQDASAKPRRRRVAVTTAALILVLVIAGALSVLGSRRQAVSSGPERLAFQPRDLVLVTRFDNRTGESMFDGAIEYALEREFSNSNVVGLVPLQRVHDALVLMKRPVNTVVDRTIGREIALRDGGIKALVGGRVEKLGDTYVLTAELVTPLDGAVVAAYTERVRDSGAVAAALARQATSVRTDLGEQLSRIARGSRLEPGSTHSLTAFQLYNKAYQLGRQGDWAASLAIAREVVRADPEFGSGWIWLALSLSRTKAPEAEIRAAAERASALAHAAPEWERLWILGNYHYVLRQWKESIPINRALLELRPDHYYGAVSLQDALLYLGRRGESSDLFARLADLRPLDLSANVRAAQAILAATRDDVSARLYVDRAKALIDAGGDNYWSPDALWLAMFDVYSDWHRRNAESALRRLDEVIARFDQPRGPLPRLAFAAGYFYLALGQLRRADEAMATRRAADRLAVVGARGNQREFREWLRKLQTDPEFSKVEGNRPIHYLRAGLVEDARRIIQATEARDSVQKVFVDVGRGLVALHDERYNDAIVTLTAAIQAMRQSANLGEHQDACRGLATALMRTGRRADAIRWLESCVAEEPYLLESGFFGPVQWMRTRLQLADEYRADGRLSEARAIEEDLRRLLAVADPDYPLAQRVRARQ